MSVCDHTWTESVSMLYLLANLFDTLDVYKPATSKEGNSEVYVVGLGYHKSRLTDPLKASLLQAASQGPAAQNGFYFHQFDEEFEREVYECAKFFKDLQSNVIQRNLRTYNLGLLGLPLWDRVKSQVAEEYMLRNNVKPIRRGAKILPFANKQSYILHEKRIEPVDSFSSRLEKPGEVTFTPYFYRYFCSFS